MSDIKVIEETRIEGDGPKFEEASSNPVVRFRTYTPTEAAAIEKTLLRKIDLVKIAGVLLGLGG